MNGLEFENKVEELLIKHNIVYKREGEKINYGHRASKGKYDFELKHHAIECKSIMNLGSLSIPGINPKTHKPYASTKIHTHQIRALRAFKGVGWLLIHESNSNGFYALTMDDFDRFLVQNDMPRSLKGINVDYSIDLERFITSLKEE